MHLRLLLLTAFLAIGPAPAQTTGVIGNNDYTVNGLGSGSTSCTTLCFPNGGVTLALTVAAPVGSSVFVFFNFCTCQACYLPAPSNACAPLLPATACGGTNQSLDMSLTAACGIAFSALMGTNTAGQASLLLPIPTLAGVPCTIATLSTQAIVVRACGLGIPPPFPGPFVLTQGYTLRF